MTSMDALIPADALESRILVLRGQKVMLSPDLAALYGVEPRALIQAVKRNRERFPADFMFQLTTFEVKSLRSQSVILETNSPRHRGTHTKYEPYAFTEQGVSMLSSVLRSKRAIRVNIAIMRAFVKLRAALAAHKELAVQLRDLERKVTGHDADIQDIFAAIRRLMNPPPEPRRPIGFRP